ncbi:MAG TPA: ABC transporter ATP-binding protein [Thermoleophilaceae bacterium]|jgi:ABC-2 type transport system ATP-binding protein
MQEHPAVQAPAATAPVLEARGLEKRFGRRAALRGVSLSAAPGELVAVIGPNGAGKTTLLSILAGIQRPDGGTIATAPERPGWVPQEQSLYGKLTVAENLRLFARLEGCADVDAAVARMLDQAGLAERADQRAATLSGGNRQRLNVAIGLLSDPPLLLLDEPSAALDPRQRDRLWRFLLDLAGRGTAIVYTTHDVREADRYATRLAVLADGEGLFEGSPRELEAAVGDPAGHEDLESAFVAFLAERGH